MVTSATGMPHPNTPRRQMKVDRPIARVRCQRATAVGLASAADSVGRSFERESRATIGNHLRKPERPPRTARLRVLVEWLIDSLQAITGERSKLRCGSQLAIAGRASAHYIIA